MPFNAQKLARVSVVVSKARSSWERLRRASFSASCSGVSGTAGGGGSACMAGSRGAIGGR